jgi:arylsulfatase A-like enzyme
MTGISVCALLCFGSCSEPPAKDNVILIILDTVRHDALGCYGNPRQPTPNIDAIAADGSRFDQAISPSGWTLPAVASLLTGAWPTIHGALGRQIVLTPVRDEVPTAPEILSAAGFTTLGIANAAFVSPMLHLDRGFDVFDHQYTYNWDARRADASIDATLQLLQEYRSRPKFLLIHLFDAHLDYDPPGEYATKYTGGRTEPAPPLALPTCLEMYTNEGTAPPTQQDIDYITGVYHGEVSFMDAQVGRLVETLKSMGIYDTSTIIITSDHGEEFWDHSGFEHGHTLYDELVRVPLIVKLPTSDAPVQHTIKAQVPLFDVMPTILDILGIAQPATFAGVSLLPLITGQTNEDRVAFSESTLYGANRIALRSSRYKYIYDLDGETGELYDWRNDPRETTDLSDELPDTASEMRVELLEFHGTLTERAQSMSTPEPVDMSPKRIEMLRSLGYIR